MEAPGYARPVRPRHPSGTLRRFPRYGRERAKRVGKEQRSALPAWVSLLESAKRGVQGHCHEVSGHAVRNGIQRLAEIPPHVLDVIHLLELEAVTNRLCDLGRRDLLIA